MKYIKKYKTFNDLEIFEDEFYSNVILVDEFVEKYGDEISAEILNIIFKGKKVIIKESFSSFNEDNASGGIIDNIFCVSHNGFMIARFTKRFTDDLNDVCINHARFCTNDHLSIQSAIKKFELKNNMKKYNL